MRAISPDASDRYYTGNRDGDGDAVQNMIVGLMVYIGSKVDGCIQLSHM